VCYSMFYLSDERFSFCAFFALRDLPAIREAMPAQTGK
jgi:hypothetical protein